MRGVIFRYEVSERKRSRGRDEPCRGVLEEMPTVACQGTTLERNGLRLRSDQLLEESKCGLRTLVRLREHGGPGLDQGVPAR